MDPYFDFIAVAKEAKAKKPDRAIFEYASAIGGFELDESWVHIGDNIGKDFVCVNDYGGHGILLNRFDNEELLQFQMDAGHNIPIFEDLMGVERYLVKNYVCK